MEMADVRQKPVAFGVNPAYRSDNPTTAERFGTALLNQGEHGLPLVGV